MNCKEVEAVVNDLARDQMMDATMREAALAHAKMCSSCAIQLEDARALSGAFRRLCETSGAAPARIEASLLAAFREHHSELPRFNAARSGIASRRWLYAAAGIAAAAIIVIAISLMISRNPAPATNRAQEAVVDPAEKRDDKVSPAATSPGSQRRLAEVSKHIGGRVGASNQRHKTMETSSDSQPQVETEIATDFIPLVNRESMRELDSGQLVRVELPRSALMSFGLPVSMEHANDRVKADVVVGQDGLARAIRFVR